MPQAVAPAPSFSTRTPDVLNSAGRLSFSLPVLNTGAGPADNLIITDITLSAAARVGPALPLSLGDLAVDNVTLVNANFLNDGLVVGSRYLVTARGTYESGGVLYGFALNRYVVVPEPVAPPIEFLAAHVQVSVDPIVGAWSYSLHNDEAAGSPRFINAISLDMASSFAVSGTPPGWAVETDNFSYVLWYAADEQLPYPHQIAPGASLGGFQILTQNAQRTSESKAFSITSWNHLTDQVDLTAFGTTLTPSRP